MKPEFSIFLQITILFFLLDAADLFSIILGYLNRKNFLK